MSSEIDLKCAHCEKIFSKLKIEFNRLSKRGQTKFFCSHECFHASGNNKKPIPLICKQCGKEFEIYKKEFTRQTKNGRGVNDFFCSRSCACSYGNSIATPERLAKRLENLKKADPKNRYRGPFTYYLRKARNRGSSRGYENDITEEYLQSIWTGRCAISNIPIVLRTYKTDKRVRIPNAASLDRIDSKGGYTKGNVQFTALAINLAKCDFSKIEFSDFWNQVYQYAPKII